MSDGCRFLKSLRQWLFESAVLHFQPVKNDFLRERGNALPLSINRELLHYAESAAGITPSTARNEVDANRRRVCWFMAVKNL